MSKSTFALIPAGKTVVENLIVASRDYTRDGYDLVEIKSGVYCSPGMFYDSSTGLFFQDDGFSTIYPTDSSLLLDQGIASADAELTS
ncbi:hypothetical protein [Candidatus Pantoea deserta]|uniref:hypothetical protein n=1 Tax=Candidatus Pantoea deserta TaxID=1869313 RepID=UPI000F50AE3B|nr:hypothetical protein [Pantoea deserta]